MNYIQYMQKGDNLSHKYDGNTEETLYIETSFIPTKELYITQQLDSIRNNALERSRNKTQAETTIVTEADVYGRNSLINRLENVYKEVRDIYQLKLKERYDSYKRTHPILSTKYSLLEIEDGLRDYKVLLDGAKLLLDDAKSGKYNGMELANCIFNLSEFYPHGLPYGNLSFASNPSKYGFSLINKENIKPGDLVQAVAYKNKYPVHAMMYNGVDEKEHPTFNYSNGELPIVRENGLVEGGYGSNKYYPVVVDTDGTSLKNVNVYRYTGTPQDSIQWANEWELQYGTYQALGGKLNRYTYFNHFQ